MLFLTQKLNLNYHPKNNSYSTFPSLGMQNGYIINYIISNTRITSSQIRNQLHLLVH